MVDRIMINLGVLLVAIFAVLSLPVVTGIAATGAAIGTSRLLVHWAKRVRRIDPEIGMSLIPEHIMRHVDARYVVFGHTHEPVAMQLGGGRWYYNTGTWVPSRKPGVLRAFTHLVIRHGNSGQVATLCQWRDGASREFTPGWVPVGIADSGTDTVAAEVAEVRAAC